MTKTYAQLAREIAALQASAQKQRAVEAKGAIAKINDMISMYGLTAGDLKFGSTSAAGARSASKATKRQRGAAASGAKFSDGQGNQWSGRGPRPAWLRDAIAAGRTLESFAAGAAAPAAAALVGSASAENGPSRSVASKQVKSRSGSRKGKPRKVSAAVKTPSGPATAAPAPAPAPADAATSPVKASRKKAAPKARAGKAAMRSESKQEVKPPLNKSPAKKAIAAKKAPASSVAKKTGRAKAQVATSKRPVAAKKPAAPKVAANRKMVSSNPADNSVSVVESPVVSVPEATAAAVAA